jgi:tyrosine-protein kinase Etk/Wzc
MGQIQSLEEFLGLLSRRRWLIVLVTVIGTLLAAVYAKSRPDTYETAAVIQVEGAAVQGSLTEPSSAAAQTLQMIEQRLTTRENLAAVIERHGIYAGLPLSLDRKIGMLRTAITFQGVDSAAGQTFGQPRNLSAIIVFARMGEPELAARVANDFAQGILDQSASAQRDRADLNVAFFREEVDRLGAAITMVEAELTAYKNTNAAALPTFRDANRDEMVSLDAELRRLSQEKLALEGEAAQITAKDNQRETDRRALDDLSARIAVLDSQIASIAARRAELEADLSTSPEVERVLAGYDRQLEQLRAQSDAANARMAQSEIDARLAERQQAERFTLLERAIVPETSVGGGNKKVALAGAFASLFAAIGLAFLLDLIFPVVRSAAQMERQLDLRPVVSIPEIKPQKAGRAGRGMMKMLDDPTKPLFGLPRFAVISAGVTLVLLTAASVV